VKRVLRAGSWIEALGGLGHASVEEVRVPLERDKRIRVPGDGLDELDIGAGGNEARYARVAQIVEAEALALEAGGPKRGVPNALPEVRRLERRAAHRGEDELNGRVTSALDRPRGQFTERRLD
jgi:hypothetical protein